MPYLSIVPSTSKRLKKEKESNQIKIDNFENTSKSLDKLTRSQISDNNRKGVGYNAVAPPPIGLFAPPTIDLSNSGLKKFKQPEFEGYGAKVNKSACENSSNEIKKTTGAPIIEDWVSDCDEDESEVIVSKNVQHKPEQVKKPRNDGAKACDEQWAKGNWSKGICIVPISTARQSSLRAITPVSTARPSNTAAPKPFVNVNSVNTAKGKRVTSAVGEQGIDAVKACWVWRPKLKVLNHVSKNSGSYISKQFDYVDPTDKKELAIPGQTTTGKELSNPLMAGSLPKTIWGIKREFSNARTPQQNRVAERKNKTLIEVARTMLAESLLPIPFWAEAVNTACFMLQETVGNRTNCNEGLETNYDEDKLIIRKCGMIRNTSITIAIYKFNVSSTSVKDET
ncbi:ribonuclease H-like domain-containing protein [Tanacetum coccineum]|uniref:Ribonuclease H-like domain-containing protein n=1 Tax=Tanacetum coccineum TaxID=301880 RepID=A0ABQ5HHY3_9ASTR